MLDCFNSVFFVNKIRYGFNNLILGKWLSVNITVAVATQSKIILLNFIPQDPLHLIFQLTKEDCSSNEDLMIFPATTK